MDTVNTLVTLFFVWLFVVGPLCMYALDAYRKWRDR